MNTLLTPIATYIPRAVSRYFRLDWFYARYVARIPILKWAAPVVVSTPIFTQFTSFLDFHRLPVILVWFAGLLFFIGYLVLFARMPMFLLEHPSFKAYQDRGNAHRWILWQFRHNFDAFVTPAHAIEETIDKGISFRADDAHAGSDVYRVSPIFPRPVDSRLHVLNPENLNNDLYLPFQLRGHRYVLPMQESDPDIEKREKELFWITYTELASSRTFSRFFVWLCFLLSGLCFASAIALILFRIWTAPPDMTPNYV